MLLGPHQGGGDEQRATEGIRQLLTRSWPPSRCGQRQEGSQRQTTKAQTR